MRENIPADYNCQEQQCSPMVEPVQKKMFLQNIGKHLVFRARGLRWEPPPHQRACHHGPLPHRRVPITTPPRRSPYYGLATHRGLIEILNARQARFSFQWEFQGPRSGWAAQPFRPTWRGLIRRARSRAALVGKLRARRQRPHRPARRCR